MSDKHGVVNVRLGCGKNTGSILTAFYAAFDLSIQQKD